VSSVARHSRQRDQRILFHVVLCSGLDHLSSLLLLQTADHYNRDVSRRSILLQTWRHFRTTDLRQDHVQQNQIRLVLPRHGQSALAVLRANNFTPRLDENSLFGLQNSTPKTFGMSRFDCASFYVFISSSLAGNYVFERPPRQALGARLLYDRRTRPHVWFKTHQI
jgi:hypothetical protein